jgi:hypothetical protein
MPGRFAFEDQFGMVRGNQMPAASQNVVAVNGGAAGVASAATATSMGVGIGVALSPVPSSNKEAADWRT